MNSPTHIPQPRRVPAETPVLFRLPQLETLRPQTRQIEVEIPLRGRHDTQRRPEAEREETGDWPYATKASAATLGLAALLWGAWVATQGPSGEPTATPTMASQLVDGTEPDFLASNPDPEFEAEVPATSVASRDSSLSADSAASQQPSAVPAPQNQSPGDFVADSATTPSRPWAGGASWEPEIMGVEPPPGVTPGSGWVSPASAGQPSEEGGTVRTSATPNPPQFSPYADSGADAPPSRSAGPALSATPNGIADWSRYLTTDRSALQPASASLPGPGEATAAEPAGGQAIYVDQQPAATADSAAAPFYE